MAVLYPFLFIVLPVFAQDDVEMIRKNCWEAQFTPGPWTEIAQREPGIYEQFKRMVEHSGSTNVTNCIVDYPVKDGAPVGGLRRAVMDMVWYKAGVLQHEGLKIEYNWSISPSGTLREVVGFANCRNPDACKRFGIPSR